MTVSVLKPQFDDAGRGGVSCETSLPRSIRRWAPRRLCRYVLRPPVTGDRLSLDTDGQVLLQLRHPWADGTTHLRFAPAAFLERLAVLVPRPRVNLLLYYRVLARARAPRS